jgi:hypothetical protein
VRTALLAQVPARRAEIDVDMSRFDDILADARALGDAPAREFRGVDERRLAALLPRADAEFEETCDALLP